MSVNALTFPSADGRSTIDARLWLPEESPKAVVQIVHGMAEHIDRYDEFAQFLAECGFAVAGHCHIGHGLSAPSKDDWGHMPLENGKQILIEDVHALRALATNVLEAEGLPYFLFGHSMGSFVARCYLARYAEGLAGAILCGTGNLPVATSKMGNSLCHIIAKLRGETHRSSLVDGMAAGGYNKSVSNPRTPVDWLSYDTGNVDAYVADERCGFMFTVGGYAAVTDMSAESASPACVAQYPKTLPLLYIAGEEDPVGECGKGVRAAAKLAKDAGVLDVTTKLYPNMRHEILNEARKSAVMNDIAGWIQQRI